MSAPFVQLGATPDPPDLGDLTVDQDRGMGVPEVYDEFIDGTRGAGKSEFIGYEFARHCYLCGPDARCLYVRLTHAAVEDFRVTLLRIVRHIWGTQVRFNSNEGSIRLPNGSYIELAMLADEATYARYQGRSFTRIAVDELTQHPNLRLVDLLRSNLRGPKAVPCRMILATNPGGPSHAEVRRRYVDPASPWIPFREKVSGQMFVRCRFDFRNNHHINSEKYEAQLHASCAGDEELRKAWLTGSWDVAKGSYFGSVLDERRSAFGPWSPADWQKATTYQDAPHHVLIRLPPLDARLFLSHDFGSAAPSVTYVCGMSPGFTGPDDRFYPRGSILLLDELATADPDDPSKGLGWTVQTLSEAIRELAERWKMPRAEGYADDACFSRMGHTVGSLADEFRRCRVYWRPARKRTRIHGWEMMRRLLQDAGQPDVPGLFVSRACIFWWQTVPSLPRDPKRPEDVDSRAADHAADACRYGITGRAGGGGKIMPLTEFLGIR